MKLEPKKYNYRTQLEWTTERKGILNCKAKPDISVACAPEFGGHAGIWSPEDLYVGAVEVCTMATFLWLADKEQINIISYKSEADGTAQMTEGALRFTYINIKVKVAISDEGARPKVERMFRELHEWCLITKSITTKVKIEPEIVII